MKFILLKNQIKIQKNISIFFLLILAIISVPNQPLPNTTFDKIETDTKPVSTPAIPLNTSPIVVLDSPNIAFYKTGRTLLTNIFLLLILLTILFSTIEIYQNRKYLLI